MDRSSIAYIGAIAFCWLGMVVAVSFIEAPLKFRAPGVTIPIGLGIGRIVFRALNIAELVLAACLVVAIAVGNAATTLTTLAVIVLVLLAIQLGAVRPRLNRRTDQVLRAPAGEELPRSRVHLAYIAFEAVKAAALLTLGILTL